MYNDRIHDRSASPSPTPPPEKQPRLSPEKDIGSFTKKASADVTDHDKYQLIVNHFVPEPAYNFPKNAGGRSFQHQWLMKYPWLKYSEQENGGYCLPCVLFYRSENLRSDPGVLVKNPLSNFKKALESLHKHAEKSYHKTTGVKMDEFLKVITGQQPSIRVRLNEAAMQLVASNRRKLQSIIETILLCGRHNIPLRGHRDSGLDIERSSTENHGNFWALLQFRVDAGDLVLRDHLANTPRNAMYTSPDIQNQIVDILGDHIQEKNLLKVRKAQLFTIIADEVTDCSNREQLGLVLRYVDPDNCCIREDLVTFLNCDSGITGDVLAEKMITFIQTHGLVPTKLRGQAYDGAGNMSGKTKGAAARMSLGTLLLSTFIVLRTV